LATSAIYLINMLLAGVVWFLFIRAFHPISLGSLPGVVGSVIFAFIIGYLAVFTPQGWGIREGILSALLAYYMPAPLAVMVAVLARLWTIVDEVMALGLVLLLRRFRESNDRRRAGKSDSVVAI
jgi:hypothetical protein